MILRLLQSCYRIADDCLAEIGREFLQRSLLRLRIEEVDDNDRYHCQAHEQEVVFPTNIGYGGRPRCDIRLNQCVRLLIVLGWVQLTMHAKKYVVVDNAIPRERMLVG